MTIAPSGDVTDVRLVSSELGDPELERKLVARVKMFKFETKDVVTIRDRAPQIGGWSLITSDQR